MGHSKTPGDYRRPGMTPEEVSQELTGWAMIRMYLEPGTTEHTDTVAAMRYLVRQMDTDTPEPSTSITIPPVPPGPRDDVYTGGYGLMGGYTIFEINQELMRLDITHRYTNRAGEKYRQATARVEYLTALLDNRKEQHT